ncbi:hypothetical protein [Bowmanella yangjiangensis]|uniref:Common-antigen outer membrane protein n=1 Tax=Bowmanella yangjiangensis TaxID=2811230 RepID=A0ABS3CVI1_9ALTE|nr:hypothetical protein [Bowmanella yangjiangensis]MBN7820421.1 hypothetical protein [Bowmanella yangjiangensis]
MFKKNILVIFSLSFMYGCASAPEQPVSTRALVATTAEIDYRTLPSSYTNLLSSPKTTDVQIGNFTASIGDLYFSAAGYPCRKLKFQSDTAAQINLNVACQRKAGSNWSITRPVLANDTQVWIIENN